MASSNVLKILYVLDMLKRTDEFHPINSTEIIHKLKSVGLSAERKTIGKYIRILTEEMGYDIVLCENKNLGWYMIGQEFEDYELKILVDAVNAAKFITAKETRILRKKLLNLATKEGIRIISSGSLMDETLKMEDKQFANKFDTIMRIIADKKQMQFQYPELEPDNHKFTEIEGLVYEATPYYLGVWGHEYYVVACITGSKHVSFYSVEMMKNVEPVNVPARPMSEVSELKDIGKNGRTFGNFVKETINLQNGTVKPIKLSGVNALQKEVVKKFGNNISFRAKDEERFEVTVDAVDSQGLYQWIAQYGNRMKIESPVECIENYKKYLQDALMQYES